MIEPVDWRVRQAEVLGGGARILPLDREAVADEVREATGRIRGGVVGDGATLPLEQIPVIMFIMHRHKDLWERMMAMAIQMQGPSGLLGPRDRQLAILRTAWLLQAPYEWGEHVKHSKRVGVSTEEIEAVIVGSAAPAWSDRERAILRACEELRENAFVGDRTWQDLAGFLDERQLIELLALVGHFTSVAYVQNSLRLQPEAGSQGLEAR